MMEFQHWSPFDHQHWFYFSVDAPFLSLDPSCLLWFHCEGITFAFLSSEDEMWKAKPGRSQIINLPYLITGTIYAMPNCANFFRPNNPNLVRNLQGKCHCLSLLVGVLLLANNKSYSNEVKKRRTLLERHWNVSGSKGQVVLLSQVHYKVTKVKSSQSLLLSFKLSLDTLFISDPDFYFLYDRKSLLLFFLIFPTYIWVKVNVKSIHKPAK